MVYFFLALMLVIGAFYQVMPLWRVKQIGVHADEPRPSLREHVLDVHRPRDSVDECTVAA